MRLRLPGAVRDRAYGVAIIATGFRVGYCLGKLEATLEDNQDDRRTRRRYSSARRTFVWLAGLWTGSSKDAESMAVDSGFPVL